MTTATSGLQEAAVKQQCKLLRMPAVAAQCVQLAEEAVRAKQNHLGYLEALLAAELDERERNTVQRRIHEARLPRMKTLDEFDFSQSPKISRTRFKSSLWAAISNVPNP
jgi:DNA replication protein DnaC